MVSQVSLRGDGDEAMGNGTDTKLLESIIDNQRRIIKEVTKRPAKETPQIWALYKEVQDYYRNDKTTGKHCGPNMVCDAFRSFPRLGLVWVKRLTQTLTQTALRPKWRKNAVFEAFLETKHPVFLRKPDKTGTPREPSAAGRVGKRRSSGMSAR